MVKVVGIGPGNRNYITAAAIKTIQGAQRLVGSQRQLQLFEDVKCPKTILSIGIDYREVFDPKINTVVLASGEPGLYGILDLVLRHVPPEEVEVIPGISSVQYFMAKLKTPMKDSVVVSLHGRDNDIVDKVKNHQNVIVLTDKTQGPNYVAKKLLENFIDDVTLYVGQNLSYYDEVIKNYTVEELAKAEEDFGMNVVVIKKCNNTVSESPMHFL